MGTSAGQKQRIQVSVKLRAKYTTDYPDTPPELQLLEPHCLSADLLKTLLKEINELAKEKLGEVMMLEIVQHVQEFLHKHDLPPVSLHEEMIKRKKKEAEEERQRVRQQQLKMEEEQIRLEQELLRRKSVNSLDDESSSSCSSEENSAVNATGTDDMPGEIQLIDQHVKADNRERKVNVIRGKLLGISSSGGYSVYSGLECELGNMVVMYEWKIPCKTAATRTKRMKQITSIRQEFENFLDKEFVHPNLVQYIEMRHEINGVNIIVEIVCESVRGGNLKEILRNPNAGSITGQTLQIYSRHLLEALYHLHNKGIVHNDLRPSLVFIDSATGTLKVCGHTIIRRLSDLVNPTGRNEEYTTPMWPPGLKDSRGGKKQDVLKLGMLVLCMAMGKHDISYPPSLTSLHLPDQTQDFLNKCLEDNEFKRYPSHDLLTHPFVTPSPVFNQLSKPSLRDNLIGLPMTDDLESCVFLNGDSVVGSPSASKFPFCVNSRSRLGTDFDEMETLGKGGFGDVIKVKNRLDGRFYAIKKIKLLGGSKMMNKLTREVELLSQMNHENIVRYYNAWIETYTDPDASTDSDPTDYEDDLSFEDDDDDDDDESDDDEDEDSEEDESAFIEFRSETDSKIVEQEPDLENEDVFEFSADFSSELIGTQQIEAKIMDISPRRFRRSTDTESSENIVFQESSSKTSLSHPSTITEEENEEPVNKMKSKRKGLGPIQYLYIQMEYCSNQTVRQLIDTGQLYKSQGDLEWQLFREIVEGLAHIHAQGMIHRDLKPGNIFLNSSGHIKIGDFGLAISSNKQHPAFSRQNSMIANSSAILAGDTGLVGTAMYLAPELLNSKTVLKYSPKVDIYSLGIIFFEMCHPPVSTLMERAKILADIRKKEIKFPDTFDQDKMSRQTYVIKWLLSHNPQERPTGKEVLQSPHVPYKIVDEELQEVFTRTLQNPNSSRYRRLIEELFSQQNPKLMEMSFYMDPKGTDSKKGFDKVKFSYSYTISLLRDHLRSSVANVLTKHCAVNLQTPLLGPSYSYLDTPFTNRVMDSTGKLLSLPSNHWVSFARYIFHQNITSLKRYDFVQMFLLPKRLGAHPKQIDEYAFDIVTPIPKLIPVSEVILVALEILSDLSLTQHGIQFTLWLNHTSLTMAILNYCSISADQHQILLHLLHQIAIGRAKLADLEKTLRDKYNIQLSPLAHKTLLKLMGSEIPLSEVDSTLLSIIRSKSSVSTLAKKALQNMKEVLKKLDKVQMKISINPGMILNPEYFEGIMFQVVQHDPAQAKKKKKHQTVIAMGGQYSKLLDMIKMANKLTRDSFGGGGSRDASQSQATASTSSVAVYGVSIREEPLLASVCSLFARNQSVYHVSKCNALVCWLGHETLYAERNELVRDLRERGMSVDVLYDDLITLEEIQEYCRKRFIPHVIILERSLWIKQQVIIRTLESGRGNDFKAATEKTIGTNELAEYIQSKNSLERSDSTDVNQPMSSGVGPKPSTSGSDIMSGSSLPSITITTVGRQKVQGNTRRRMDSQTVTKLMPLLQTYSSKHEVDIIVVDFELEPLCLFAAELNKAFGRGKTDLSNVIKTLNESDNSLGKKYVMKVCETIQEKMAKKSSAVILYSHVIEQYQIIVNNLTA